MTRSPNSDAAALQAECDFFNSAHPVGTPVTVQLDGELELFVTATRSPAQVLSGHSAVIWLENVTGCYLLDRVRPIPKGIEASTPSTADSLIQDAAQGYALVPREVNDTMLAAFAETACSDVVWALTSESERQEVRDGFAPAYRAMLAAALPLFSSSADEPHPPWPLGWTVTKDGESWTVISPDGQKRRWFARTTAHDDSPFMWAFLSALAATAAQPGGIET